ncbi:uncharacterized protein L201_001924 [Kwoniella dendrophila CBS 6074]|uniref:Beta-lactamase-related domain-containing protein n=1 Tax=Kwoniella dendrophila CBS 6074 TaxID=1295534 RepID=A0AAX4JQP0_9TREE
MLILNEPGTKFEYGINMDWTGILIERICGKKLQNYFIENIFSPLGINDTCFDFKGRPDLLGKLVPMHIWDPKAGRYHIGKYPHLLVDNPNHRGGGGLHSTAKSFLAMISVLLNGGEAPNGARILETETVNLMFLDHCKGIQDKGVLGTNAFARSTDHDKAYVDFELLPGVQKGWGLSFLLNTEDIPNGRKAYSAEWGGIANLFWMADPASEVGMVIFNDILPFGVPEFLELQEQVQQIIYSKASLIKLCTPS